MGDAPGHLNAERSFILQQGFEEPAAQSCELQYSALLIQPRVILAIVVIATILQSPPVFLALSAILSFGGFCLGSFVYHLLRGRASFALRTLPWARGRT
jgi:hypothetical protein